MTRVAPSSSSPRSSRNSSRGGTLLLSPGARAIVQAALREDVSVAELGEMATVDPVFALRVLSVANSAAYSLSRQVSTVQHAASLLGVRGLRNVALGMLVADLVPAAEGATCFLSNCLRRAIAARELAQASGLSSPEDAFFAGLLLEVGLLQQACDDFDSALEVARAPGRHRTVRERAAGFVPHPLMGAQLARELSLPETMVLAIAHHHAPARPEEALAAVCWAAEYVASVLEAGHELRNLRAAEAAADRIGVGADAVHALIARIPTEVGELSRAFDCAAGPASDGRHVNRSADEDLFELHSQYEELIRVVERLLDERDKKTTI